MIARLKRLVGPMSASSGVIGTPPLRHTWVLRWVKFVNPTLAPITFSLGLNGTANAQLIIQPIIVQPNQSYREYMHVNLVGPQVDALIPAGETVNLSVTGSGGTIVINGIDLS